MDNAEKHHLLHPHQYGSRKGKMCISAVLLKRISYDHIRQTRRTDAIMFDNDAARACYDRIIPSLAAMMSHRAGMPRPASHVMIRLLLKMEYQVRTAYVVANVAFSNLNKLLLGVSMQGAGHSGTLWWALTSSIILGIMDKTQGAEFHSPYPHRPGCHRTGEAFVNDTALWILHMGLMFMMLTTLMQQSAKRWASLIHATGGRRQIKPPQMFLVWH
jgi:hypothetical protein